MNTKELTRRRELCSSLNIDFDEASELFSDDTLESMQMAKVSGGGNWFRLLGRMIIDGIIYLIVKDEDETTQTIKAPLSEDGIKDVLSMPSDSTIFRFNSDGSYEYKKYGTGDNTPTGGPKPPSPSPSN